MRRDPQWTGSRSARDVFAGVLRAVLVLAVCLALPTVCLGM